VLDRKKRVFVVLTLMLLAGIGAQAQ